MSDDTHDNQQEAMKDADLDALINATEMYVDLTRDMQDVMPEIVAMTKHLSNAIPENTNGIVVLGACMQIILNMTLQIAIASIEDDDTEERSTLWFALSCVVGSMIGNMAHNNDVYKEGPTQ